LVLFRWAMPAIVVAAEFAELVMRRGVQVAT